MMRPLWCAAVEEPAAEEVVTNVSTSGGKGYGINIGRFNSYGEADRVLMKTLLSENATLGDALAQSGAEKRWV